MEEDQTERLIELIHNRPGLYDKRLKDYSDRDINKKLWIEVCEAMVESWHVLTPQDKMLKGKEIQQRWQNLRTCFKREINRTKSGQSSKKRRKYIYYNQLLFLMPTIEEGVTTNHQTERVQPRTFENTARHGRMKDDGNSRANSVSSYERSILNILKKKNDIEEIDEDKCFLLSLVPSFRKMSDGEKIDARMEFLSVIRQITQTRASTAKQGNVEKQQAISPNVNTNQYFKEASQQTASTSVQNECSQTSSDFIEISDIKIELE